jgi:threonylcarbamoyladenosine tRNA methylthiotransferase MtaB
MKVFLDSIGCRLNQAEIESYAAQLRQAGHTLVAAPAEADLTIVNTCAVTAAAAADSRQKVRQAARAGSAQIVVTGCWATLQPEAAAALPGVSGVTLNARKDQLVSDLLQLVPPPDAPRADGLRAPIPGLRARTRAFIKVQDGCDNHCTFCITTVARGAGRSRPRDAITREVEAALASGAQEIVLTGVHLGAWGRDFDPPGHLYELVTHLLTRTAAPRLRLSSLEPWGLWPSPAAFFALWQEPRLCRHLHLPLQAGSAAVLRRMARQTTPARFAALVAAARNAIPGVAITTDLITGFPGETEAEFQAGREFVRQLELAGGHVFTYSPHPGTAAARLPAPVPAPVAKARRLDLQALLAASGARFARGFLGQTLPVLWEAAAARPPSGWTLSGWTDNYLRVQAAASWPNWNQVQPVRLEQLTPAGLIGVIQA